jgi:hypothetical protein
VTAVVIDDGRIPLLNQDAGARSWSLPGGNPGAGSYLTLISEAGLARS